MFQVALAIHGRQWTHHTMALGVERWVVHPNSRVVSRGTLYQSIQHMIGGCEMCWSFFCSGHGKGPHDGAWAMIKRFLYR